MNPVATKQEVVEGAGRIAMPRPWRRPLIVGASGQVGAALCHVLTRDGADQVWHVGRGRRDGWLTLDLAALRTAEDAAAGLAAAAPDLVVCSGAMTFVDGCEAQSEAAFRANAYGPAALASYARQRGVPFVFFSTDYVFDGTEEHPGPYVESDQTHPLSVYGRSKREGELAVLRVYPEALVVRTSWVYGPDAAGKNFISFLLRQLRAGERVRVPADQLSTPTLNSDLARATLTLAQMGVSGIVHVTGPELMSRLELAQKVAAFFSLPENLIEGVPTSSLGQVAPRPLRSGLRSERTERWTHRSEMRSLEDGLAATTLSPQR